MKLLLKYIKRKRTIRFYKSLLKENSLCFDIGANIGYKSSVLLDLKHKVVAFEPQEECHKVLTKIQKFNPNFTVSKLAIGSENKEQDMWMGNHIEIATLSNKFKSYFTTDTIFWNQKNRVKVVTLNSQIERYGIPEFCKIDVEGYEYEVLKNLKYKIPLIEFEFTGGFINETMQCITTLSDLSAYSYNLMLNEKPKFVFKNWLSSTVIQSKINGMNIKNLHGNIFAKLK